MAAPTWAARQSANCGSRTAVEDSAMRRAQRIRDPVNPTPGQESSQVRSAQSARSYEGSEHPAKPSWPRSSTLFDHLIRSQQYRLWDVEADRLRSLEVNEQLEFGRLLDWEVGWLCALEKLVHIRCRAPKQVRQIGR